MNNIATATRTLFGYDATENRGRRRPNRTDLRSEDRTLRPSARRRLVATTRDIRRNYSVAAWAIRVHLDYTSKLTFQPTTGIPELDKRMKELMKWWSKPENCDYSGRHNRHKIARLLEAHRTVDGDVFLGMMQDGTLKIIEGDRVRNRSGVSDLAEGEKWHQGVKVDRRGRPVAFSVHGRTAGGGFRYERDVPAQYTAHHGYFDRSDQYRGISPISSALNMFADTYESWEYALAKMKINQIFGLTFSTGGDESPLPYQNTGAIAGTTGGADADASEEEPTSNDPQFNFNGGPQVVNLDPGEAVNILESKNPSTEFQAYMRETIMAALKSLDIPYSFYAENFTNYSGARQALLQYSDSATTKREDNISLWDRVVLWRMSLWVKSGDLILPRGMMPSDLSWDWRGVVMPWIDPQKEVNAAIADVGATFRSRRQVVASRGGDWDETVAQIREENETLLGLGINPTMPGYAPIMPEPGAERSAAQ